MGSPDICHPLIINEPGVFRMSKTKELADLKGIGPKRIKLLERLNIFSEEDLLYHFPRKYENRSPVKSVQDLVSGCNGTIKGIIKKIEEKKLKKGLSIIKASLQDKEGNYFYAVWFNQPYLKKKFRQGQELIVSGKISERYGNIEISVQDYEIPGEEDPLNCGPIVPFYSTTEGLNQRFWRDSINQVRKKITKVIPEILPPEILMSQGFIPMEEALNSIHFPQDRAILEKARRRLIFQELFLYQVAMGVLRSQGTDDKRGISHTKDNTLIGHFRGTIPFQLTRAQERVIQEVNKDMESPITMQRLVQGDVGSGKTVIAACALLKAVAGGYQGILMAPTEILARQHYENLAKWFKEMAINVVILTGNIPRVDRERASSAIAEGEAEIIIGTHALIQEKVLFKNPGLIVIDEQHRFGVRQRALLEAKGFNPDVLVMSATPIPRSLALTIYGDLDISTLDELPPGRQTVETYCIAEHARYKVDTLLKKRLSEGAQGYIVCPLVEENENLNLQNAEDLSKKVQQLIRPYKTALLHGRMPAQEKDQVMARFRDGSIHVLVSTTVIEVGVNVPNATVMIIENAERFGLAQLHQLRGRVGRGSKKSYCILMTSSDRTSALQRLKLLTQTNDGFRLAEEDLKNRGPGEYFGTKQHGMPKFKIADLNNDIKILIDARNHALRTLQEDPYLQGDEHRILKEKTLALISKINES